MNWAELQLNIKQPSDWYSVTAKVGNAAFCSNLNF
jgi:hypothetical protein